MHKQEPVREGLACHARQSQLMCSLCVPGRASVLVPLRGALWATVPSYMLLHTLSWLALNCDIKAYQYHHLHPAIKQRTSGAQAWCTLQSWRQLYGSSALSSNFALPAIGTPRGCWLLLQRHL